MNRPTIAELEKILQGAEPDEVEIDPAGNVKKLSDAELIQRRLRLKREELELLENTVANLRAKLRKIVDELGALLPDKKRTPQ
jgi:hypothetical protein